MILGGALADEAGLSSVTKAGLILFPLMVHSLDLIASTISVFFVKTKKGLGTELEDPLAIMKRGYYISISIAAVGFFFICYNFLNIENYPGAYLKFYFCGVTGIVVSFMILLVTQYHTDYNFNPVINIAKSSRMGHATNIIAGIANGLESTGLPVLIICVAILFSFFLGESSGIMNKNGEKIGGLYGTAIATMGMFATGVYVLSMSGFGPIADNAGGIVEMS